MAFVPKDGRLTEQNILSGPLTGGEVMYIVSPGNSQNGIAYQITTLTLAQFFSAYPSANPTIITKSYPSVATDTRILVELSPLAAITVTMLSSSSYAQPILVMDVAGTVSAIDTVTINFSGGQMASGQSSITLSNAYAGVWLNPLPSGGFYLTQA